MPTDADRYRCAVFYSSYGELMFDERFQLMPTSTVREEHKEAALQEWFAYLRDRLQPETQGCPKCHGLLRNCVRCGEIY